MGQQATVLLATFTIKHDLDSVVRRIFKCFEVENERLFIFSDIDNRMKKIVTYNAIVPHSGRVDINAVNNTIRINRKKESNTLYTINALNKVIQDKIGHTDPSYNLNWMDYQNTLMILDKRKEADSVVVLIRTALYRVLDRETFEENRTALFVPRYIDNNPKKL